MGGASAEDVGAAVARAYQAGYITEGQLKFLDDLLPPDPPTIWECKGVVAEEGQPLSPMYFLAAVEADDRAGAESAFGRLCEEAVATMPGWISIEATSIEIWEPRP